MGFETVSLTSQDSEQPLKLDSLRISNPTPHTDICQLKLPPRDVKGCEVFQMHRRNIAKQGLLKGRLLEIADSLVQTSYNIYSLIVKEAGHVVSR